MIYWVFYFGVMYVQSRTFRLMSYSQSCLHDATWRLQTPLVLTLSSYRCSCGDSIARISPKATVVCVMDKAASDLFGSQRKALPIQYATQHSTDSR